MPEDFVKDKEQSKRLWEHRLHVDTLFYSRLNFFLLIESVLLGAVGALFSAKLPTLLLITLSILGLVITIVWWLIQIRHRWIFTVLDKRAQAFPEYAETVQCIGSWFLLGQNPAICLLTFAVPGLVLAVWIVLLYFLLH